MKKKKDNRKRSQEENLFAYKPDVSSLWLLAYAQLTLIGWP